MAYLADGELSVAPADPGSYEGGQAKPAAPGQFNKWCSRECERCNRLNPGEPLVAWDFSRRVFNQPWKHIELSHSDLPLTS